MGAVYDGARANGREKADVKVEVGFDLFSGTIRDDRGGAFGADEMGC